MKNITFSDMTNRVAPEYYPSLAKDLLPSWYKELQPYEGKKNVSISSGGFTNSTAKKCMPLFDAMSAGYIIKTHTDINIVRNEVGQPTFEWPDQEIIRFHSIFQVQTYPGIPKNQDIPKFVSPWSISTDRGYSCWFKNPANSPGSPIKIFEGVVDTDTYSAAIHFPFVLDQNFVGIIPAGTPIAQVIPFKRESFKMLLDDKNVLSQAEDVAKTIRSKFFNAYKDLFWHKKTYS